MFSRRGTNLTPYFPDLAPVLRARLPHDLHLDAELVAFDPDAGRLDFAGLQARMTAGRRLRSVVERRPAQLVAFDVLSAGGEDLRGRPLRERRQILERELSGLSSPIVLCQQTSDLVLARRWMVDLTVAGIEGVVVKDEDGVYPTGEGVRSWWKVKAKTTLDMLAIGFTGDQDGSPVTAGATTVLTKAAIKTVAPLLRPTGNASTRVVGEAAAVPRSSGPSRGERRRQPWSTSSIRSSSRSRRTPQLRPGSCATAPNFTAPAPTSTPGRRRPGVEHGEGVDVTSHPI